MADCFINVGLRKRDVAEGREEGRNKGRKEGQKEGKDEGEGGILNREQGE